MSQPVSLDAGEIDAIRPWRPLCAICLAERDDGTVWSVPTAQALVQGTALCAHHARMAARSAALELLGEDGHTPDRGRKSSYEAAAHDR